MARRLTSFSRLLITGIIIGGLYTIGSFIIPRVSMIPTHVTNLKSGECTQATVTVATNLNSTYEIECNNNYNLCRVCKK